MVLENIVGNLLGAYKQVVPGTMLHSDQLQAARLTDPSLRNFGFYSADGPVYFLVNGVPHLAMTRGDNNLVLRHIEDAFSQLTRTGNYHSSPEDVVSALASESTVDIDLTRLGLQGDDKESSYLAIPTTDYDLNEEEKKLAERVHGSGLAFEATMNMLAAAGIEQTRVYVLNPRYVREHAKESPIGRASWLCDISNNSSFSYCVRSIISNNRLRGIAQKNAETI